MIIVSQDSNKMINIKDLSSIKLDKVITKYDFYKDIKGQEFARIGNWEYVFYVNDKRFATYPKEYEFMVYELRDMLIEAIKNGDKIFQFVNITSATLLSDSELVV